jgi:hypothetical protein
MRQKETTPSGGGQLRELLRPGLARSRIPRPGRGRLLVGSLPRPGLFPQFSTCCVEHQRPEPRRPVEPCAGFHTGGGSVHQLDLFRLETQEY